MSFGPIFLDVTTTLNWGSRTAVGIVRVEHYLIKHVLETYQGDVGFVVFDQPAVCFRTASRKETRDVLKYLYGAEAPRIQLKLTEELVTLGPSGARQLGEEYFTDRIAGRLRERNLSEALISVGAATFSRGVEAMSVAVHLAPGGAFGGSKAKGLDRKLIAFEPYRDKRDAKRCWLLMAGLTWDYMFYDYLADLTADQRIRLAHVIYDTIPVDFPQFVPNATHLYHRHFVELGHCASVLYAISDYSAERYTKAVLEPNLIDKTVHACGLPDFLSRTQGAREPEPIARLTRSRFAVFCSTIEARKNHLLLVNIWDRLLQEHAPEDIPKLVFVGKWGWAFEATKNQIDHNPRLRNHVVVLESLSDASLIWLYQNADFTLFPSFSEGWGLAASESLFWGTPVVHSDAPALTEASQGLMPAIDPLDFAAWKSVVGELCTSQEARDALRTRAAQFKPPPFEAFAEGLIHQMSRASTSAGQAS